MSTNQTNTRKRRLYTHPCDACSIRKVKCDLNTPCNKCVAHNVPCTRNRVRKKVGRKDLTKKTRDGINNIQRLSLELENQVPDRFFKPAVTIDQLLPSLQIYQTWFYGVWPVVSVALLTSKLVHSTSVSNSTEIRLTESNISSYALSCAVSAAIYRQLSLVTTNLINLPRKVETEELVRECLKARYAARYMMEPNADTLLTSFFLYIFYVNSKGGTKPAVLYLREAISLAQVLGLHDNNSYLNKTSAEVHRLRKIYYLLLVTERFMCLDDNVPVILDACIPYPSLLDEEYLTLLSGFTELVKVFAIPDKPFFDKLVSLKLNGTMPSYQSIPSQSQHHQSWVIGVQQQLNGIKVALEMPDVQKVNIILSKFWMMALTWDISKNNGLLLDSFSDSRHESLMKNFPITITTQLLTSLRGFQMFAFELNGSGACVKLLDIANSLIDSIIITSNKNSCFQNAVKNLNEVFLLASTLRNDTVIAPELYEKVQDFLSNQSGFVLRGHGYLSELSEEDSEETSSSNMAAQSGANQEKSSSCLLSELTMAFCSTQASAFNPLEISSTTLNALFGADSNDPRHDPQIHLSPDDQNDLVLNPNSRSLNNGEF